MTEHAAHTPGPWEVGSGDNYYISSESYPAAFPHRFKGDDTGDHLAYVGNRTSDFGEANARLIAAAPELMAALETMVENFRPFTRRLVGASGSSARVKQVAQIAAYVDAKAALAKARTP